MCSVKMEQCKKHLFTNVHFHFHIQIYILPSPSLLQRIFVLLNMLNPGQSLTAVLSCEHCNLNCLIKGYSKEVNILKVHKASTLLSNKKHVSSYFHKEISLNFEITLELKILDLLLYLFFHTFSDFI